MSRPSVYINPKFTNKVHINPNFLKQNALQPETVHVNPLFLRKVVTQCEYATQSVQPIIKMSRHKLLRKKPPTPQVVKSVVPDVIKSPMVKIGRNKLLKASMFVNKPKNVKRSAKNPVNILKPSSYKLDNRITKHQAVKFKVQSKNKKLVLKSINGVLYKSSTNRLMRQTSESSRMNVHHKSDRLVSVNGRKFLLKDSGKKLVQITKVTPDEPSSSKQTIYLGGLTFEQSSDGSYVRKEQNTFSARRHLSSSKYKSINILLNRMRKSNVPCPIYRRLGKCLAYTRGRCPKVHDRKQVNICPAALRGGCTKDGCLLSHDLSLSKMPTCKYFLQGRCFNENCPYLHKKLNEKVSICEEFLKGFCPKASHCNKRHELSRPESEKKKPSTAHNTGFSRGKIKTKTGESSELSNVGTNTNKRYFMEPESTSETEIDEGKEKLGKTMEKVKSMKAHHDNTGKHSSPFIPEPKASESSTSSNRPPIGKLPSFIPI